MKHAVMGLLFATMLAACGGDDATDLDDPTPPIVTREKPEPPHDDPDEPDDEAGHLDVQLFSQYAFGSAGSTSALFYRRIRLYANGAFEECSSAMTSTPGGVYSSSQTSTGPQRKSGSYQVTSSSLQLAYATGERKTLSLAAGSSDSSVRIDGRLYQAEEPGSTALCDFD